MDLIQRYKELLRTLNVDTHTASLLVLAEVMARTNTSSNTNTPNPEPTKPRSLNEINISPTQQTQSYHFEVPLVKVHIVPHYGHTQEVI